ncbi:helix-hairpin-helix domain-containing protein [Bacteriovoracales bacterium]|nr:helix-hairpin-helix domain-containing protein [Bacteriovoracales bacterium]
MIGYLKGSVVYSSDQDLILMTNGGVGYQVFYSKVLPLGIDYEIYVKHIKKENSEDLYGFTSFGEKKMFELLIGVKGIGPKSAYNLVSRLGLKSLIRAISFKEKKVLTSVPGIGPRAGAQILLDLTEKVASLKKSFPLSGPDDCSTEDNLSSKSNSKVSTEELFSSGDILDDAIKACEELGFSRGDVVPIVHHAMLDSKVKNVGDIVRLVLKEL